MGHSKKRKVCAPDEYLYLFPVHIASNCIQSIVEAAVLLPDCFGYCPHPSFWTVDVMRTNNVLKVTRFCWLTVNYATSLQMSLKLPKEKSIRFS